jgi:hypothetical protein
VRTVALPLPPPRRDYPHHCVCGRKEGKRWS